jgi:CRISPR-associated endoribonuclease Cas6
MNFNLVHIVITVRTDDAFQLSLRLPLLGHEFAAACRNNCCRWPERDCCSCSRQASCSWNLVFGQNLSSDPSALKRFQKPPLPFMFTFPSLHDPADGSTVIECGLVVIGQAIPCLDLLLEGFREILLPLAAEVLLVGTRDYQGIVHPLGDGIGINYPENLVVLSINDLSDARVWAESCLHIRLITPLRLFEDGRLLGHFNFSRFARSLLRRVSSLAYYYGAYEFACDYKELSRQADAVICTDNHFVRATERSRKTAGLMGDGRFRGDFGGLLPFLVAGLYIHAGKGSSFGMGAYELLEW